MTLRVCLIGSGDIKYHYFKLLNIEKERFEKGLQGIAKVLVDTKCEIVLLPDRGVCFEIAKEYKRKDGKKVIGTVPLSDKDFGIAHLKQYIEAKIDGRKVFDEFINTNNWYKQDLTHCLYGDLVLMLGNSLGSLGELVYGFYLYKLFTGKKPEVKAERKAIHQKAMAGERIPYSVVVYKPFIKEKLNYEIEAYIRKLKGKVYYVKDNEELKRILIKLGRLASD